MVNDFADKACAAGRGTRLARGRDKRGRLCYTYDPGAAFGPLASQLHGPEKQRARWAATPLAAAFVLGTMEGMTGMRAALTAEGLICLWPRGASTKRPTRSRSAGSPPCSGRRTRRPGRRCTASGSGS